MLPSFPWKCNEICPSSQPHRHLQAVPLDVLLAYNPLAAHVSLPTWIERFKYADLPACAYDAHTHTHAHTHTLLTHTHTHTHRR